MNFEQFASAHGLVIRDFKAGIITRCSTTAHPSKRNGAFYYDLDFGWVQDWAIHSEIIIWKSDKVLSPSDLQEQKKRMEASKKAYRADQAKGQAEAAKKADWILSQCHLDLSAYLASKGFPEMLGNMWMRDGKDPLLCVPMRVGRDLVGVQLINPSGDKIFLKGQRCNGAEHRIGQGAMQIWVEGYATALSVAVAMNALSTPCTIHVCFSASNMQKLATEAGKGLVIADNDQSQAGEKAAIATKLPYFMPDVVGWDFCDLLKARKKFAASQELKKVLQFVKK